MKKYILITGFVFFLILISINLASAQAQCANNNCSIDAALVFHSDSYPASIYYSFYGHNPKIPEPVNSPLTYSWWTPTGVPYATIPSPVSPAFSPSPSVAFERSTGYPAVVWYASNYTTFTGFIYYSKWNGANWSTPEIVYSSTPVSHIVPVIAIDVNDTVLVAWLEIGSIPESTRILSKYKTSSGWSALQVVDVLTPGFGGVGGSYPYSYMSIDMTFRSNIVNGVTIHDAYLVWQEETSSSFVNCGGGPFPISHFKIFHSYWNGSYWAPGTEIDGQPNPNPPSVPYNVDVRSNIGISSDKFGNVTAVWSVIEETDPCVFAPTKKIWTSTKSVGSSSWQGTQMLALDYNDPAIAFTPEDIGIALYSPYSSPNNIYNIFYSLKVNGTWTSTNTMYGGCGSFNFYPKIASLHKGKAMAVWEGTLGPSSIVCTQVMDTNSFSVQPLLPPFTSGSHPDIAAHTGSPQNPHAEWSYLFYQASDNDLDSAQEADRSEMRQVGSTNLVNAIVLTDRPGSSSGASAKIRYIKKNAETLALDLGERNTGDGKTLEDFMAFGLEKYPSKRTLIDLNDHGMGWRGVCIDDDSSEDRINYTELKEAHVNVNNVFNLHVFSACLMGQLEIAHLLKDYGNYMVASEETMDSPSLNYNKVLSNITNEPFISDSKYASNFVDIFKDIYSNPIWDGTQTLSAIDLSKIQALTYSVSTLAGALIINAANYSDAIKNAKNMSQEFPHPVILATYPRKGYRDIKHFAQLIKETINNTSINLAAQNVINKVNDSVVNNWANSEHAPNATGLSIYLPLHKSDYDNNYNLTNFYTETLWDEFITEQSHDYRISLRLLANPIVRFIISTTQGIIGLPISGNKKCSSSCGTTISDVMCLESQTGYNVALPIVDTFNYTINGSSLQTPSSYDLTINLIIDDALAHQKSVSGTINPGQIIYGEFSSAPSINLQGTPSPGSNIAFQITAPKAPNENYALGLSLGNSPGITLPNGRNVPLNPDILFTISLTPSLAQSILNLTNNIGTLNQNGQAQVSMTIPNVSQAVGLTFYTAFVTINSTGINEISQAIPITIQP
ncbi:MAG: clostripain-related cysteine peptidase [Nanoarchaeota archaeon]